MRAADVDLETWRDAIEETVIGRLIEMISNDSDELLLLLHEQWLHLVKMV